MLTGIFMGFSIFAGAYFLGQHEWHKALVCGCVLAVEVILAMPPPAKKE